MGVLSDKKEENKKSLKLKSILNTDLKDLKLKLPQNINFNKIIPEKKKKVVAFDLGSSTIKIVQGTYYKNELTIDKYIKIPSPKDAVIDGEIKKDDELAIRISEVLKSNNIKAKHGICTTNSTLIINREILNLRLKKKKWIL